MGVGPVELIVCTFPHQEVAPSVAEALAEAVSIGTVALLDLVFIRRSSAGVLSRTDLDDDLDTLWRDMIVDPRPRILLSDDDLAFVSQALECQETAFVIVLEHRWSRRFFEELAHAGGTTTLHARIPHGDVVAALRADGEHVIGGSEIL